MQQRLQPLVVLVGGTSGCGKSTLAHLLANRLGIATVISTDGIRELLRSRRDPETCPELFASTYEAHLRASKSDAPDHVDSSAAGGDQPEGADDKLGADDDQQQPACPEGEAADRIYSSFERQATHVLTVLDRVLRAHVCRGDSVLVEGVHLLPAYAASLTASLTARGVLCIPMIVHIVNAEKHLLRFAIRSKSMTLKPQENKYVSHFASIRCIQKRLVDTAKHLGGSMLLVNNTNVDKSLSTIHFHVLRMVDRMMVVQQQSTSTTSSSVVGSPTNWATASSLAMLAPSPVSDGAVVGIMQHPPAATGSAPTTTVAPLHDVKGKHVVTLLMRRRAEKRQRRARSAEVVIGGGAAPSNASGSTPPQCISPVHGAQSAGCGALDVFGATTAASDTPTTLAPPQQGGGRPPLHAAVKHHGLSPPLGPTGATGTSPSSLSAQRSLSADASDPRRRYGGSFSTACNSRTTMPAVSESEDEVDGHGCGSGSDVASGDESQGADAGEDPCVNRSGGRSPGAQGVAMMQPRRRNDGTFARMHKRNTSSGADDDDEAPSLVGS